MCRFLPILLLACSISGAIAQVKPEYLFNTTRPFGTLDIRTRISATHYYYLQEDVTFSFRESSPGVRSTTYLDMTSWDSSPYRQGNMRRKQDSRDEFVMNYRALFPAGYDQNYSQGYPLIVLLHGGRERGNCFYEDCYHADNQYDPSVNQPAAPTAADHKLLNNDYHLEIGAKEHLAARDAAAGKLPNDPSLKPKSFPGFVLMPQMLNVWDSLNVQDVIRLVQLVCQQHNVDENRIYIEGLSIGGYATYEALKRAPWLFAAAIPVSAVSDANIFTHNQQKHIAHVPIWVFQGGLDKLPSPAYTEAIIQKLRNVGAQPRYDLYPQNGHVVWGKAFAHADFFPWLKSKNKADIHVAHSITHVDASKNQYPVLEVAEGFFAYQWEKDGSVIASATSHKYTVTAAGKYRVRFSRISASPSESQWNQWSAVVTITAAPAGNDNDDDDSGNDDDPGDDDDNSGNGDNTGDDDDSGNDDEDDSGDDEDSGNDDDNSGNDDDSGSGDDDDNDNSENDDDSESGDDQDDSGDDDSEGDNDDNDNDSNEGDDSDDSQDDDHDDEENDSGNDDGDDNSNENQDDDQSGDEEQVVTDLEEPMHREFTVYPNPVLHNTLSFEFNRYHGEYITVSIHDAVGKHVYRQSKIVVDSHYNFSLELNLQPGTYILAVKTKSGIIRRRLQVG